jgi:hypothetical protein
LIVTAYLQMPRSPQVGHFSPWFALLVEPMSCHTILCIKVHRLSANLDFHRYVREWECRVDARMKGLIAVLLRMTDVVIESSRHSSESAMNESKDCIAVLHG